jgi:DNA-binding LacI/PurR family transcriptional regulator
MERTDKKPDRRKTAGAGRPTIKMIAGLAKVAVSTVSRAINDDPSISSETRKRIERIVVRVGFVPNVMARNLVTRRSDAVALILGSTGNPHSLEMIPLLSARLAARGVPLTIIHMDGGDRLEDRLASLARHAVGGCLVASASLTAAAARFCQRLRLPVVLINRLAGVEAPSVACDNRVAGRQVGELLLAEGRRRLAYVGAARSARTPQDAEREAGLRTAARRANASEPLRFTADYGYAGGRAAAAAILASRARPDGVFVANDITAFGVLDGLRAGGVEIPGELSLVGFDDLTPASWLAYGLTTVRQPTEEIVDRALAILEKRILRPDEPCERVVLPAQLVRRHTTLAGEPLRAPRSAR